MKTLFKTAIRSSVLFALLMTTYSIFAQPAIEWQKCYGGTNSENAYCIEQTSDGGCIFAGFTNSNDGNVTDNHGNYDCWIVKLNSIGEMQWQKCLGGTGEDRANSIYPTTDGGYIVAGYTRSNNGDVSGNNGGIDCWVVKLSSSGEIQWQKCLGGSSEDRANSIHPTTDGGYIVASSSSSTDKDVSGNHGNFDSWAVKLDAFGKIKWQKCLGGSEGDYGQYVKVTHDKGYILTGYTRSNNGDVTGNHGGADFWVVKLDGSGSLMWQKTMGGSGIDNPLSVLPTKDGGFIVAGSTTSNDGDVTGLPGAGYVDIWVVKLGKDPALPVRWLSVDATLNGNTLQVDWKVASETNTAHFEVQASNDGIHFSKIGENIISKATNVNNGLDSSYHFTYTFNSHLFGSGIIISLLGLLLAFRQKNKWIYILVLASGIMLTGLACTKSANFETKSDISKLFIRIVQVNKDGTKDYSKVVKVK